MQTLSKKGRLRCQIFSTCWGVLPLVMTRDWKLAILHHSLNGKYAINLQYFLQPMAYGILYTVIMILVYLSQNIWMLISITWSVSQFVENLLELLNELVGSSIWHYDTYMLQNMLLFTVKTGQWGVPGYVSWGNPRQSISYITCWRLHRWACWCL